MVKSPRSTTVPKPMQATYDAVAALTDAFCRDHLTGEYPRSRTGHDCCPLTQAPKSVSLGATAHLGLWHHLRIGLDPTVVSPAAKLEDALKAELWRAKIRP